MNRFAGHLRLRTAAHGDGRTVISDQSFRAPFHVSKPYWDADARMLVIQVVNPTAGILAGDRLETDIAAGSATALIVTTPGMSRIFSMADGMAEHHQRFRVARGAWLEVSPEPLVPHHRSRFRQSTEIDVEPGGALFFVDQVMPGRIGSGEAWTWTTLTLDIAVRLGAELILRERFAHSGAALCAEALFHGCGRTACFANAILVPPHEADDASWRSRLHALHRAGTWVGVSALHRAGWVIRVVASDSLRLRDTLREIRATLAAAFPRLACPIRKL